MASEDVLERDEERRTLIRLALGKASVAFMRQSAEVVMPTEELLEVAEDIHAVWALEVDNLAAELRELRKDRERLDFALRMGPLLLVENDDNGMLVRSWDVEDRADIDSAMAAERERHNAD